MAKKLEDEDRKRILIALRTYYGTVEHLLYHGSAPVQKLARTEIEAGAKLYNLIDGGGSLLVAAKGE
jgi:hypothetical protein